MKKNQTTKKYPRKKISVQLYLYSDEKEQLDKLNKEGMPLPMFVKKQLTKSTNIKFK
tara:strand:+ start:17506 stop:17676 length:171 start_codon:yes stop_codon:yes gene_type:complete